MSQDVFIEVLFGYTFKYILVSDIPRWCDFSEVVESLHCGYRRLKSFSPWTIIVKVSLGKAFSFLQPLCGQQQKTNNKVELLPSRVQVGIHVATVHEYKTDMHLK